MHQADVNRQAIKRFRVFAPPESDQTIGRVSWELNLKLDQIS
jgi:hypothetical protein